MDRLTRVFAIRPGEGRLVALVAGAFAAVEAGRGLGEVGVDTLVLSRSGADILPVLYIGLGLTGLIITLTYGAALSRSRSERFFPTLLLVLAGVLAVEWVIALSGVEAIFPLVWISVYAAGLLLLTAMWTVSGFTFDARQAKRLFPLLTSAAIVGSLAGFLSAIVVQRIVGAEALILAEAVLFVAASFLLRGLGARVRPRRRAGEADPSVIAAVTAGASYVRGSALMRLVAVAYVLLAVLMFSVTFPFMRAMSDAFPDESELLTVLALFSAAVTVASFLVGTLLANRLYAWLGVATVALVLPLVYLAGFGLWLVRFTLATAVIVRLAQQVAQRGVTNAAFSAFYSVIPSSRRGQVMAFMDGVPGQLGTMLSGVLLILAASLALEQVFVMGFVTAVLAVVVVVLIRRSYAASLVGTLREGLSEQVLDGGPGLAAMASDARVIEELRTATHSERDSERQLAADLLGRLGATAATDDLIRLTTDDTPGVRRTALAALAALVPDDAESRLEAALGDDDAEVRAAAIETLCRLGAQDALGPSIAALTRDPEARVRCELAVALDSSGQDEAAREVVGALLTADDAETRAAGLHALARFDMGVEPSLVAPLLDDEGGSVRAAAIGAAAAHDLIDDEALLIALADPDDRVRDAAASALAQRPEVAPRLVELLELSDGRVQEAALASLGRCGVDVHGPLVRWAEGEIDRAAELRRHGGILSSAEETSAAAYLGQVVGRRESAIEARMLSALAILGAPEAVGLIRRNLRAADAETRAQAIEAVDALGDPRLARGIVRLLDSDVSSSTTRSGDIIRSAQALADDRDPWVRALALRALAEYLERERHTLAERIRVDPDALIREVVDVPEGGEPMSASVKLVSDVDRMLTLRRVPLFAALAPEDLQRVASMSRERSWAPGDALMTEGEIGSELVVIVEGSVRVVRSDDDTDVIRTYGPGDHIGELAVLRESTRAATVLAEQPGVRGLVIEGEAVQSLLRERPDAAMAMLATLAERISAQR